MAKSFQVLKFYPLLLFWSQRSRQMANPRNIISEWVWILNCSMCETFFLTQICHWKLQPCTESLFRNLFLLATEQASDILLGLMSKYHQFVAPDDLREILYKDAVYNALGMAGFEIYTQVHWSQLSSPWKFTKRKIYATLPLLDQYLVDKNDFASR